MKNVVLITPSTITDFDEEVVVLEKETWEEVLDKVEQILEAHFIDYGWSGEINISMKLKKLTKEEIAELELVE